MGRQAMYYNPKLHTPVARHETPLQPNYQDEVTEAHVAQVQKLVDPDGSRAAKRKPLYNPGW